MPLMFSRSQYTFYKKITPLRDVTSSMKRYTLDENLLRKKILLSNPMLLEASIADVTIDSVYGDIEELSNNRYVLKLTEEAQKLEYVYIKFGSAK